MEMTKKENLIWLAGFFDGEGSITVVSTNPAGRSGFNGQICFANMNPVLRERVGRLLVEIGTPAEKVQWSKNCLRVINTYGRTVLEAILPYIHHPKQLARAEVYLEMFAGQKGETRPEARQEAYVKWLELKIKELQEA